jgi:hypothetical protein
MSDRSILGNATVREGRKNPNVKGNRTKFQDLKKGIARESEMIEIG